MEIKVPLGNWFNRILEIIRNEVNFNMRDYNIDYAEFTVLYYMAMYGDGQSSANLTKTLILDKAAVSRAVKRLENEGYIERTDDSIDKRQKFIYLTEKGHAMENTVTDVYDNIFHQLIEGVDKKQVYACLNTLNLIYDNALKIKSNSKEFPLK